jgi:STE24 endopeptidase
MSWLPPAVVVLLLLRLVAQLLLEAVNRSETRLHSGVLPGAFTGIMDEGTFTRAADYTLAKSRLASVEQVYETAVLAVVLFSGVLPALWSRCNALAPGAAWSGALFLAGMGVLLSLPGLPLEWWAQFRLEEKFGFNRSTIRLWLSDQAKSAVLGLAIGFPLAWALLTVVRLAGRPWWIWGFVLVFGFQLLMMVLYPKLILPLFNRLAPLPEGELRGRLLDLAERTGFRAQTIEVMDGSKRSGHSNAFFTGFGRFRRIVLFDTLVAQLAQDELGAVLAHEIGHYKRGHIPKFMAIVAVVQLGAFALVAWLARAPWINSSFGLPPGALAPAFLLSLLLSGPVLFWFSPIGHWFSRRNEFEADAFAREAMGSTAPIVNALRKLARKNLSNLTPHPLYSTFYYSHPTIIERERALSR